MYTHGTGCEESTALRACGSTVELTRGEKSDGRATRERPTSGQRPRGNSRVPLRGLTVYPLSTT
eukprot:1528844-Prymnesium_polylepis.1